ncbi:MAG: phosphatidate cytidylyltransferase [Dehalococcoidia bacterium]
MLTGIALAPVVLASVWWGPPWFSVLVAAGAVVGCWEFYRLARVPHKLVPLGAVLSLSFALSPLWDPPHAMPLLLSATMLLTLSGALLLYRHGGVGGWGTLVAGPLYTGYLMGLWLALRMEAGGRDWVLFGLIVIFASDTLSYFTGRLWGRHRLAPAISPGKTYEGAVGGLAAAGIAAALLSPLTPLTPTAAAGLGLLLSVVGQVGDLAESHLKRSAGAKDSGGLLPGHGGLLDRIDSIVFAGPLLYLYVAWFV